MLAVRSVLLLLCAVILSVTVATAQGPRKAKHVDMRTHGSVATRVVDAAASASAEDIALQFLRERAETLGFVQGDLADVGVSSTFSSHNGATHVYLSQRYGGIEVHGAYINLNVTADGDVLGGFGNSFVTDLAAAIASHAPSISALDAARSATRHLGLDVQEPLAIVSDSGGPARETTLSDGGIADRPITAKLVYERLESGEIVPSWLVEIAEHDGDHWWVVSVDAQNGDVLEQEDLTVHDTWMRADEMEEAEGDDPPNGNPDLDENVDIEKTPIVGVPNSGIFHVIGWPHADPNDGPRRYVINPADPVGSPFGWNDTNGVAGAESTQTVGNNVDAYLDRPDDDVSDPSERVDGGPNLLFDFPMDLTLGPQTYQAAAITNLYYWNNIIHDIAYRYGFDEAAGNFQANNYGKFNPPTVPGNNDYVRAEAQDGSGMNNANFSTGTDGNRPRMQMFLWVPQGGYEVQVQSGPVGNYAAVRANFGAFLADIFVTQPTAQVVLASPANACAPLVGFPAGSIAYVDAGTCNSVVKTQNAQNAGAVGIIINTNSGAPVTLTGISLTANIPVLGVSSANNAILRPALPFTAKMAFLGTPAPLRDGDFDAGVIVHEYGHGISNRLTGGRLVANCLNNNEQMGEGWSDWLGLTFTHSSERSIQRTRGMGPYIRFTGVDGPGIRTTRYATDMTINPTTYGTIATGTLSIPHGIGYAWATMLWEVYWNLIDKHGFNQNVYDPWFTGGNNLAIQLVMDGMKLQPCRPGFVSGRNAILQADDLLTGGANSCAIWKGFVKRGLGFSASEGSTNSVNDGVQAFDLPPACRAAISVEPGSIYERVRTGRSIGAGMRVWNNTAADGANLNWAMHEAVSDCSVPADVPWLSLSPASGSTVAQSFSKPQAALSAVGLAPGNYTALVCFTSDGGSAQIPVTMNVKP